MNVEVRLQDIDTGFKGDLDLPVSVLKPLGGINEEVIQFAPM